MYNQPVKISAVWFPKEERIVSTMIGVNFSIVGNMMGFFLPYVFVTTKVDESMEHQLNRDLIKS
jgi:hypothetical protein